MSKTFTFDGDCSTEYIDIRDGKLSTGPVLRKFCTGSLPSGQVRINSTAVRIGWSRNSFKTVFTGTWRSYSGRKYSLERFYTFTSVFLALAQYEL